MIATKMHVKTVSRYLPVTEKDRINSTSIVFLLLCLSRKGTNQTKNETEKKRVGIYPTQAARFRQMALDVWCGFNKDTALTEWQANPGIVCQA